MVDKIVLYVYVDSLTLPPKWTASGMKNVDEKLFNGLVAKLRKYKPHFYLPELGHFFCLIDLKEISIFEKDIQLLDFLSSKFTIGLGEDSKESAEITFQWVLTVSPIEVYEFKTDSQVIQLPAGQGINFAKHVTDIKLPRKYLASRDYISKLSKADHFEKLTEINYYGVEGKIPLYNFKGESGNVTL